METYINCDIAQLRPAHGMVHVVFAEVVLGQVCDVRLLDMRNVRASQDSNIHGWGCVGVRQMWKKIVESQCHRGGIVVVKLKWPANGASGSM